MDPVTLALIAAGLFAAFRIRRSSHPPKPEPELDEAPTELPGYAIPTHLFGSGLPPAITAGRFSRERTGTVTPEGDEDEPPKVGAYTPAPASEQSNAPDVAGVQSQRAPRAPTYYQWVTPTTGRYAGQRFLLPVSSITSTSVKVLSPPQPG